MQNIFAGTTKFAGKKKQNYIKSRLGPTLHVPQDNPERLRERERGRETARERAREGGNN